MLHVFPVGLEDPLLGEAEFFYKSLHSFLHLPKQCVRRAGDESSMVDQVGGRMVSTEVVSAVHMW